MDVVTFVRDRLTERDERARAILRSGWVLQGVPDMKTTDVPDAHLKDAKRELRDVTAKRAIVDAYEESSARLDAATHDEWDGQGWRPTYTGVIAWRTAVKHLAVIDDSHPDYDESWRP